MAYEMLQGTRAPVRMWADPASVEPDAHGSAPQRRQPAVDAPRRGHAGRALRQGRDRRLGHRDAAGRLPGRGRRRHRLRHGRGADASLDRRRPAGRACAGCAHAIEAAIPVGFAQRTTTPVDGADSRRDRGWAHVLERVRRRCTTAVASSASKARAAARHARRRQPLHRALPRRPSDRVWLMLHSGLAQHRQGARRACTSAAGAEAAAQPGRCPTADLAVFLAGTPEMDAYRRDLFWAQEYARAQPGDDAATLLRAGAARGTSPQPRARTSRCSCHHNYVAEELHYGEEVLVTRKGAIRAGAGELGIIPGSMGTGSYIVRGLGNPESFEIGVARRRPADVPQRRRKRTFTDAGPGASRPTGVECRKDAGVLDEIPGAYKDIDEVMEHAARPGRGRRTSSSRSSA